MHTEPDVTRMVRSWLRTDEHESAERVLGSVLAVLDTTPQRQRVLPARRFADLHSLAKFAVTAAAVMVVTVVGINTAPAIDRLLGGATVTPSPSATPPPNPSPAPAAAYPSGGTVLRGSHSVVVGDVQLSFDIPSYGWESPSRLFISKSNVGPQGAEAVIFWTAFPGDDHHIPCVDLLGSSVSPSVADLANAVLTVAGTDVVSGPSTVTVGGRDAKHVELFVTYSVLDNPSVCQPGVFYSWTTDERGASWTETLPGDTVRVWIVDVEGTTLWIEAESHWNAGPDLEREIQQIVDSIRFE